MIVRWTRRSLDDLRRIAEYIAHDNPPAAAALVTAVHDQVSQLKAFPLLGRVGAYQDTRELVVHRNYIVTYRARSHEVQVLQVWHVARGIARTTTRSRGSGG